MSVLEYRIVSKYFHWCRNRDTALSLEDKTQNPREVEIDFATMVIPFERSLPKLLKKQIVPCYGDSAYQVLVQGGNIIIKLVIIWVG